MSDCQRVCEGEEMSRQNVRPAGRYALPWRIWFLLIALAFGLGVGFSEAGEQHPEPVLDPSPAYRRMREVEQETKSLLKNGDTAGLEALAQELRSSKEALEKGTWLLSFFYEAAASLPEDEPAAEKSLRFYRDWAKRRPASITAQVCLARALAEYAWIVQGAGSDDPSRQKRFDEIMDQAWQVLDRSGHLDEWCPGWFEASQIVAFGMDWEKSAYLAFVEEAIKREPTYGEYQALACTWLRPERYGEEGDFESWIESQVLPRQTGMVDREYARWVWLADNDPSSNDLVFDPGRLDWERTKRGFEKWLEEDGSEIIRFEFARLAVLAKDRATAQAQFNITGARYYPPMWDGLGEFEKAWAFAHAASGKEDKLRDEVPAAIRKIAETITRVAGGLSGGILAGVCLLVFALQRNIPWAGVAALVASVIAGCLFGTLVTIVPAAGLYLYLRRLGLVHPPEFRPPSGWIVLLWIVVLAGACVLLQMGSGVLAVMPEMMNSSRPTATELNSMLSRSGMAYRIFVASGWICFLGLMLACPPQDRNGWLGRLGLSGIRVWPSAAWIAGAAVVIVAAGLVSGPFLDSKSTESLAAMGQGVHSPGWYFLAVVVAAPIIEELIFRGYGFSGLVAKIGAWGAILIPGVIFASYHLQYGWAGLAYVFLLGVTLGVVRWKTGSVFPCIALHSLNNLASFLMSFFP